MMIMMVMVMMMMIVMMMRVMMMMLMMMMMMMMNGQCAILCEKVLVPLADAGELDVFLIVRRLK